MLNRIFRRLVTEGRLWLPVTQKNVAQDVVVSLSSYPARPVHDFLRRASYSPRATGVVYCSGGCTMPENMTELYNSLSFSSQQEVYDFMLFLLQKQEKGTFAMTTYNDEKYLKEQLDLVLNQAYSSLEVSL